MRGVLKKGGILLLGVIPTFAASPQYNPKIDTAPIISVVGLVVAALGTVWVARKVIKIVNRS